LNSGLDRLKSNTAGNTLICIAHEQSLMAIHLCVHIKPNVYARITHCSELDTHHLKEHFLDKGPVHLET
jgi:hypothetical protein